MILHYHYPYLYYDGGANQPAIVMDPSLFPNRCVRDRERLMGEDAE